MQQNVWKQRSYGDYTAIVGLANDTEYAYLLAVKKEQVSADNIRHHYFLVSEHYSSATSRDELSLDSAPGTRGGGGFTKKPAWVSSSTYFPMAAMRVPKTVAICIDGGLMVIDPRKDTIDVVALESAGREEAVAFEEVGQCIDCLHSQSDGKELRVSRVKVGDLKQKRTTTLPPTGEAASDLLTDTRGGGTRGSYTNTSAPLVYSRPHTSKPCSSRREDALWKLPRTHSRCAGL